MFWLFILFNQKADVGKAGTHTQGNKTKQNKDMNNSRGIQGDIDHYFIIFYFIFLSFSL